MVRPESGEVRRDRLVVDFSYWSYVTVVGRLEGEWASRLATAEVERLEFHPGLRSSWPRLRGLLGAKRIARHSSLAR